MQTFNLTRLNFHSPYKVWAEDNEYKFITDYEVSYRIIFSPNNDIWKEGAYEFGIFNENQKISPNDPKVKGTVEAIIEEFFLTNPNILLYQCETGDNRQAMRARLFAKWFNEYENKSRFFIKVSVLHDDDIDNYIALIVQKSNPELNNILQTFNDFISYFSHKPE